METIPPEVATNPQTATRRNPWFWVPSLYFSEGVPYVIVMTMSIVMYTRLGIAQTQAAFYTSCLYLPWVIKPLWSPFVDITRTKRLWIVVMQFTISVTLALVAFALPTVHFLKLTLGVFWVMALASATHDIAADGFYMLSMSQHEQALWVGLRSAFYRGAMIAGNGLLVMLAGALEVSTGNNQTAWSVTLFAVAGLFLLFSLWHAAMLPRPANDGPVIRGGALLADFASTLSSFFRKPGVGMALAFILLYRFDEAQLTKVVPPFLLNAREKGGLALSTFQIGKTNGFAIAALTCGGLLGGFLASKYGLKKMLPFMLGAMYLPKLAFVFLSYAQPTAFPIVCGAVSVEQFGYGFGFTAFMLYLLYFADGPRRTAHYSICTGFMALGMMLPGMWSGWLAQILGYRHFSLWVICSALPGFVLALRLNVDPHFGKKNQTAHIP
jgi:PAT family beta-lactamase induction signal transducer AmpG